MSVRITIKENDLAEIWDETLEENGWVIMEQPNHTWALYSNCESQILNPNEKPFKIYANHELGEAISQGQKWT